jgi:hypothetical protein
MCLSAFLLVFLIGWNNPGNAARSEIDPVTYSIQALGSERRGNALFTPSSRRGSLDWSKDPTIARSRFIDVNANLLSGLDEDGMTASELFDGSIIDLNLFDDVEFTAVLERLDPLVSGGFSWVGRIENVERSLVTFVVKDGKVTGNIALPDGLMYQVRYAGNGVHGVREVDQSMFPAEAEPLSVESRPDVPGSRTSDALVAADDGSIIDVLVVYTPGARDYWAGGTAQIEAEIQLAVSETNSSYENSGIVQRLNLVHMAETNYTEGSDFTDALYDVTDPNDGLMDEVHTLRDTYCADEVVLIVGGNPTFCGVAWLMNYVSAGFESHAFAVVHRVCATGYYSFGHELGHNMGAQHDWYVNTATTPYPYSHGYVNTVGRWRTVMAYNTECSAGGFYCTRIPYFSNPDVTYGGAPTGVPEGQYHAADNRKTFSNTAYTVANFRQSCSGAPPDAAVLISPSGTTSDATPAYSWTSVADSSVYYLNVTGYSGTVIYTGYTAEEVCSGDTCSVTPDTSLTSGNYTWKIQTWNSYGYGPWSSEVSFRANVGGGSSTDVRNQVLLVLFNLLLEEE